MKHVPVKLANLDTTQPRVAYRGMLSLAVAIDTLSNIAYSVPNEENPGLVASPEGNNVPKITSKTLPELVKYLANVGPVEYNITVEDMFFYRTDVHGEYCKRAADLYRNLYRYC